MTDHASSSTDWDASGLIPPFDPEHPTHPNRSPYRKSLSDFVVEFGVSKLRRDLLASLLDFRDALHQAQLTRGFQWINGSFAEHVEVRQDRDPKDIDVVTFFYVPDDYDTQRNLLDAHPTLFESEWGPSGSIHSYFHQLNTTEFEALVHQAVYWYSLWSHTREGTWKGFLEVDLAPVDDMNARQQLEVMGTQENHQS